MSFHDKILLIIHKSSPLPQKKNDLYNISVAESVLKTFAHSNLNLPNRFSAVPQKKKTAVDNRQQYQSYLAVASRHADKSQ